MSKYLQDLSIWIRSDSEAKKWGSFSNFLETLYFSCLPKVETNGVFKVVVVPCRTLPESPLELMLRKPDAYQISRVFDFEHFFAADRVSKQQIALDLLQGGLLETAKTKGWDITPFRQAYATVLARNFVNYLPWSKLVGSPNRKHKAQVWCDYGPDKAGIYVVFFSRNEVIGRALVTTVKPGNIWIREAIGKLKWLSPMKVQVTSCDKKSSWEAAVPTANGLKK